MLEAHLLMLRSPISVLLLTEFLQRGVGTARFCLGGLPSGVERRTLVNMQRSCRYFWNYDNTSGDTGTNYIVYI